MFLSENPYFAPDGISTDLRRSVMLFGRSLEVAGLSVEACLCSDLSMEDEGRPEDMAPFVRRKPAYGAISFPVAAGSMSMLRGRPSLDAVFSILGCPPLMPGCLPFRFPSASIGTCTLFPFDDLSPRPGGTSIADTLTCVPFAVAFASGLAFTCFEGGVCTLGVSAGFAPSGPVKL